MRRSIPQEETINTRKTIPSEELETEKDNKII